MEIFNQERYILGESPVWMASQKRCYWVDIFDNKILSVTDKFDALKTIDLPDKVGCIVPTQDGNLVAALSKKLIKVTLSSGKITTLTDEHHISEREMFNDGKVDSLGRFWVATKDSQEDTALAKLYLFDGKQLIEKESDVTVGNGLDWSLDNKTMYFTDSPAKNIYQYDFDLESAQLSNKRIFAKLDRGLPDGLTIDSQGQVWGAHWEGGCVTCYAADGKVIERIDMPCEKPTSCAFVGEKLDTLMITSSTFNTPTEGTDNGFVFFKKMGVPGRLPFLANL
jgi:sugar lactone lactonase YvrE